MTTVAITATADHSGELLATLPAARGFAWVRRGEGLVGWGTAEQIAVGTGRDRFGRADEALRDVFSRLGGTGDDGRGPVAFGAFTFDPHESGSTLVVPRTVLRRHSDAAAVTSIGGPAQIPPPVELPRPIRVRYAGSTVSEIGWLEAVDQAAKAVRAGDLEKVVLARDLQVWAAQPLDVRVLARRLAARFQGCWTFIVDQLVGATPELLVRRRGADIESIVLAGSAPRGRDPRDDDAIGERLTGSAKDIVEHEVAVASVVDSLGHVCDDLLVAEHPSLLRLANVQHLATRVTGRLSTPMTALALAGLLHPTAAVCGTPTPDALEHIRASEGMSRGRYSGPVGWVDAAGDGEFGIALRCAEISGARARLFAGAGIVGSSLPEGELEETRLKLRAMQSALEATAP